MAKQSTQSITFDKDRFHDFKKKYFWKDADEAIYGLFEMQNNCNTLASKINILDAVYSTNLFARSAKKGIKGINAAQIIASHLLENHKFTEAMRLINEAPYKSSEFSDNIDIYVLHGKVMDSMEEITGAKEAVFASKFLHFYNRRLFPILDSRAEKALMRHKYVVDHNGDLKSRMLTFFPNSYTGDNRYRKFCFYLLAFSKYIQQEYEIKKEDITVKSLDIYLYSTEV